MKKRLLTAVIASLMFFAPAGVFAADAPAAGDKPAGDKPAAPTSPATPATPGARGNRPGGGFGGPGGFGARDPLAQLMTALGDVNLETDFTLTPEQKEKIQVIVTDFKKQMEKWRTDHEADLKKIPDDFAALRNGGRQAGNNGGGNVAGGNNRQQFQQATQARQALMETAPKADEAIAQIKGLLTTEQLKKLQTKIDERQAEAAKARQQAQRAFGGNRGAAGGNAAGGGRGGRGGGAAGGGGGGRAGRGGRGGAGGGAGGV
jgi:hypothetical protein